MSGFKSLIAGVGVMTALAAVASFGTADVASAAANR